MIQVLGNLAADHAGMARVLRLLEAEIEQSEAGGTPDFQVIARVLDYFLSYPDLCHHPIEDLILRKLEARDAGAAKRVGDLTAEHDKLAGMIHKLAFTATRRALGEERPDAAWFVSMARSMLEAHRHHMEMEDRYFFPVAERLLTDADWAEIDAEIAAYDACFKCRKIARRLEADIGALLDRADP